MLLNICIVKRVIGLQPWIVKDTLQLRQDVSRENERVPGVGAEDVKTSRAGPEARV